MYFSIITIVKKKNDRLIKILERQFDCDDQLFLGLADQELLIQKLSELKGCNDTEHLLDTLPRNNMNPSLEDLEPVLRKNKNKRHYCLHCPRVRRMLLHGNKWLHSSQEDLSQSHISMVFVWSD